MSTPLVRYDKHGRLRVQPGMPVYECNAACACPPDCNNRVVQRGISVRIQADDPLMAL